MQISRIAYIIHAALSALVLGLLTWATVASLRLENAAHGEAQARAERDRERSAQLAVYQMENLATAILSPEMLRPPSDFAPLYPPGTDEIRLSSGEFPGAGFVVKPSPLLLVPPKKEWVLLHFQASPRSGYHSPELIPEQARTWHDFDDAYEVTERERFATTLGELRYAYTVDELAHKYEQAGGTLAPLDATIELASDSEQSQQQIAPAPNRSEYTRRRQNLEIINRAQGQQVECAPEGLAVAQLHAPTALANDELANDMPNLSEEVGISFRPMLAVWIKLASRDTYDLAFLRAVHTDGEVAFQGFIVDWQKCKADLLKVVADRFPHADLEVLDPPPAPDDATADDTVLGVIPARFQPNLDSPLVPAGAWNSTHTFLLVGWVGTLLLLAGGALGIRALVNLTERRTEFAYAVTHELRTPLTTFRLYTDMLAQGLVDEDSRQAYLETLNNESQRLADLVSGVLEYSRVENNSVPLNRERVKVRQLLDLVAESCNARCTGSGMRLEIEPGDVADTAVLTDRHHLVHILANLVDNACKYGRNDEDPVVRVAASRNNGAMNFDVTDRGRGVPARLRSVIFKPYQRGDVDSVPATGGIGLGLALSRSWARLLGGSLDLIPPQRDERGAHFRLTLPLHDE
ncbi:MAG TPA: HAMP domain-containing sensor histidine kinase [Phycisphaerae bacterium]|nr:HAMP domain-containing sensor histidine kinase [Phycisphaerae bacterium]